MTRHRVAALAGAIGAVAYLAIAVASYREGLLPVRPFYQGPVSPPPYEWVSPPPELAPGNIVPKGITGTVKLSAKGSVANTISTDDAQAIISFYDGSIKPLAGETAVRVTITPVDPTPLGAVPAGDVFDSNAYSIVAVYAKSKKPAVFASASCPANQQPKVCPTLLLRYATVGTDLDSLSGGSWTKVDGALSSAASLQLFADVPAAGTFVVVGPKIEGAPTKRGVPLVDIIGIALGALAIVAGVVLRQRSVARTKAAQRAATRKRRR